MLCLCTSPNTKREDIRVVFSHHRFLESCPIYLKKLAQSIGSAITHGLSQTTTTAAALVASSDDQPYACICSERAAALNGLEVIDSNIGDDANASSRFIFLSRTPVDLSGYGLCSLRCMVCCILKNIPGAIFKVVSVFAFRNINITNMFTRPHVTSGESHFNSKLFFEFQPDSQEQAVEVIEDLKKWAVKVKNLGVFPEHLHNRKAKIQSFEHLQDLSVIH